MKLFKTGLFAAAFAAGIFMASGALALTETVPLPDDGNWYVDATTGSDVNDGRSLATAKASIQAAINASSNGDLIIVNDGCYGPIRATSKSIEIRSVNGAKSTIIDGNKSSRCVTFGKDTNTVLDGFTLQNGTAYDGGGVCRGTLNNCVLSGNTATWGGGAYFTTLSNCTLSGNSATRCGGGAYYSTLENCVLSGNSADNANGGGGGAYKGTLNNCVLKGNSAWLGGGADGGILNNCILSENTSEISGGGAYYGTLNNCVLYANSTDGNGGGACSCSLNNCIVWKNTASTENETSRSDGVHTCSGEKLRGVHNIQTNPCFVDAENGDYRLQADSPCIDAGWIPDGTDLGTDMAGHSRWQGCNVDIGAYEYPSTPHLPRSEESLTWYVDATHGDNANSGLSWSSAKADIQTVVESARDGDTIFVSPGTYEPIATLDMKIHIASTGGCEVTVIDGLSSSRCATLGLTTTNTVLEGFTLQNGIGWYGGGSFYGTVNNCVLSGNRAECSGGGASSGALNNCVLWGNSASFGGGSCDGTLNNCVLSGNLAGTGGGSFDDTLNNCIVWGNTASPSNNAVSGSTCSYSCLDEDASGAGNIFSNPHFVDAANGDFRLQADSPCIDAGLNAYVNGYVDLVYNARIAGDCVDMGAYEYGSSPSTCTISLDKQGGSGGTSFAKATYGAAMPGITVPTRTGYTFGGYYTSTGGSGTQYYTASGASARNWDKTTATTLYAKWTANTYAISYDLDGGTEGADTPSSGTWGTPFRVPAPTKDGHTFLGWTVTGGLDSETARWGATDTLGTPVESAATLCVGGASGEVFFLNLTAAVDGSVTLTANWERDPWTYTIENGAATVTGATQTSGDLIIPATLGGCPVTGIGVAAFRNCTNLTSVTIPDSVTSIGAGAFSNCTALVDIAIPPSVTSIGNNAFNGCDSLHRVDISDLSVWCGINFLYCRPFVNSGFGCLALDGVPISDLIIPSGVKAIETFAFYGCTNITSVTLQEGFERIGFIAFAFCSGITNVFIPNSVTAINDNAFNGCRGLTDITIPDNVKRIEGYTFKNCTGLRSVVIGRSLSRIDYYAFDGCTNLASIRLEGNAPVVYDNAFRSVGTNVDGGCIVQVLKSSTGWGVDIPGIWQGMAIEYIPPVFTIENGMLTDVELNGWSEIEIPDSVTSIRDNVFSGTEVSSVSIPCWLEESSSGWGLPRDCKIIVRRPSEEPAMAIEPVLTHATNNVDYSVQLVATGGTAPYTFEISASEWENEIDGITYFQGEVSITGLLSFTPGYTPYSWTFVDGRWRPVEWDETGHWHESDDYTTWFDITVTDAEGLSTTRRVTIVVDPNPNNPPECWGCSPEELDDVFLNSGESKTFSAVALDPEEEPLAFRWTLDGTNVNGASSICDDGDYVSTWTWTPNPDDIGAHELEVYGSDGVYEECLCVWSIRVVGELATLPVEATPEAVTNAIESVGFADAAAVMEAIGGSAAKYAEFKAWAQGVPGGEAAVVASPHAAVSFQLGAAALFGNEPTITITGLEMGGSPSPAAGGGAVASSLAVTVTVKDGGDIAFVSAEKVAAMFEATSDLGDWNGAARLTPTVNGATHNADSTMTFTIVPGDSTTGSAFLRVKVK